MRTPRLFVALLSVIPLALACSGGEEAPVAPPVDAPAAPPAEAPAAAPSGPAPGALAEPEWGKEYWIAVVYAADPAGAAEATAKAVTLGAPADAIITGGFDCETGVTAADVGAAPDATFVYVKFDTEANARAFADRFGPGGKVARAISACGG